MCLVYSIRNSINYIRKINTSNKTIGECKFSIFNNNIIIYNLFVNKEFRNIKIGTYLLNTVYTMGLYQNNKNIYLTIYANDYNNVVNFYKKNGFKIVNDNIQTIDDGENIYNLIKMLKRI